MLLVRFSSLLLSRLPAAVLSKRVWRILFVRESFLAAVRKAATASAAFVTSATDAPMRGSIHLPRYFGDCLRGGSERSRHPVMLCRYGQLNCLIVYTH
jgi:hypothetical protein